jgi:outer membrane protein assembly factor BamE
VRPLRHALLLALWSTLAACSVPQLITPYRMEIQQGNYVSQEMVSQLRPGMTREQVRFVLGTPLLTDIFHADRWDYVFYRDPSGGAREQRKLTVIFVDGRLARVEGDVVPAPGAQDAAAPESKPAESIPMSGGKPVEGVPMPDKKP